MSENGVLRLHFLGAAQNVTGSRFLVETKDFKVLVDAGLYQERSMRDRNWDNFPIAPHTIDAVVLTHAHLDHCGWLPRLVKLGFSGKIFATTATAKIAKIVMLDSAHLQEEDAEFKKRRHQREGRSGPRPVVPLYTVEDAQACEPLMSPVDYDTKTEIGGGITVCFHDAGHILGSSMVEMEVPKDWEKRTILFSGDVGRWDKPILRDPSLFEKADYILCESTYGDRVHEQKENTRQMLEDVINSTNEAGGNIVIPSFSVERAQEILYHLNELLIEDRIPHLLVFLDSPMAIRVTDVFRDHPEMFDEEMLERVANHQSPFSFSGLVMTTATQQSKTINHINGTVVIIAGSGMCTGGRIKHHLVNNIERRESTILFSGYQAKDTLGRIISEGHVKKVRILGQHYHIKARVVQAHGFSGHADRDELMRWLSSLKQDPRHVFIVHGEEKSANSFRDYLREQKGWNCSVPAYGDVAELE